MDAACRFRLTVVASLCGLVCVLGAGVASGRAVAAQLGARQIGATETQGHPGEGEAAGQLFGPVGVAVNNDASSLSFGGLFVADQHNWRVDRFAASSGAFQLAWGSGVASGASELQTCTTSCRSGLHEENPPYVTGGISYGDGVAVDSGSLSLSAGDVYVVSVGTSRVEKFGPAGEFLLTFGGEVNETSKGDVCGVGEKCRQGTIGSANGQFNDGVSSIAVGPGGLVYVGDKARVQVFEASGAWKETISLSGLSSTGVVTALAVDSSGDVFVFDDGVAGVREFVGGVEKSTRLDAGSTSVASLAVDPSGDVYVGDSSGGSSFGFHVLKYNASGKQVGDFGSNTVRGGSTGLVENKQIKQREPFVRNGMAFSEASGSGELYVSEFYDEQPEVTGDPETFHSSVWVLPVPPPGPLVVGESAAPGPRGSVSLEATINPEGNDTTYHFEYLSDTDFNKVVAGKKCEWVCASSTPAGVVLAGSERLVSARVTGLMLSSTYHYRVVATNSESLGPATGPGQTFETLPSAVVESEYVTNVASTSATVDAVVNPLESSTEYRVEYGTSAAYEHVVSGNAGAGTTGVLISPHLQELSPGTVYHYRVVLRNELGMVEGADRTFTTQTAGGELALPDGRAWELVSPPNKKGALIEPWYPGPGNLLQAASGGGAITYLAEGPYVGENPQGKILGSQVLSARQGSGGWRSTDLTLPDRLPENGVPAYDSSLVSPEYHLFSEDLSLAAVEPQSVGTPPLSPEATERTVYLRNNLVCANQPEACYTPLVTAGNVPPETKFGGDTKFGGGGTGATAKNEEMHFVAATPDLSHVVLASPFVLTGEAMYESSYPNNDQWNLYEWGGGRLRLVNILPDGEATHGVEPSVRLADGTDQEGTPSSVIPSAVSGDGRRIAWSLGVPYGVDKQWSLFVRDMVQERTVQVGGPHAVFQWMNSDGSEVFFLENGDLYVFDFAAGTATDLTAAHGAPAPGDAGGGVQEIVSDVSGDGSYVYFVATSVLANAAGALSGQDNLYLLHDTGSGWSTTYIATLSHEDKPDWQQSNLSTRGGHDSDLSQVTSRVSPHGRYLAFMSSRPLTGYDNTDALSGQADEEVYLYDAAANRLVCASCNPTGARPVGVLDRNEALLVDRGSVWSEIGAVRDHWLAASIPGWDQSNGVEGSQYQPRYLSDSGRLFFNSPDVLVPQDVNGVEDVYQYEPAGIGDCTGVSPTFGERSGGCVGLISSGTSGAESAFLDASENGDDVFFLTLSRLVSADFDNGFDVYDAHVCSAAVPCVPAAVSPPACSSGDSCKAAPSPQPAIFGPAPSATFNGAGNATGGREPNQKKTTKKAVRCKHGKKLTHGKCVKKKAKKAKKAGRVTGDRRARR